MVHGVTAAPFVEVGAEIFAVSTRREERDDALVRRVEHGARAVDLDAVAGGDDHRLAERVALAKPPQHVGAFVGGDGHALTNRDARRPIRDADDEDGDGLGSLAR